MKKYLFIGIILFALLLGTSFAWYMWSSTDNPVVKSKVCTPEISFVGGTTINGTNIKPVFKKEDGLAKTIEIRLDNNCSSNVFANIYLVLDSLPVEFEDETFKFELWQDNISIVNDSFGYYTEGDEIPLLEDYEINSDLTTFTLYIYMDANLDNSVEMANKSFSFHLYGEGSGAIIESNVIESEITKARNENDTFLNSSLLRKNIETISIAENNIVPSEINVENTLDISSNKDNSVMMWWTDNNENGLYEVVIGGSNGKVRLNKNSSKLFAYLTNAITINLNGIDTSNVTNLQSMFQGCSSLTSINLNSFNTSNVTKMISMFFGCSSLTTLDLTNFNTKNVTSMYQMFYDCSSLESVLVGNNWIVNEECNTNNMFTNAGISNVTYN